MPAIVLNGSHHDPEDSLLDDATILDRDIAAVGLRDAQRVDVVTAGCVSRPVVGVTPGSITNEARLRVVEFRIAD